MQLIVNTFGASLRKKDDMFLIKSGERKITMSPRKVQTIWLATGVHLSTDAIRLALEHHVDIALLDKHGEPYGRFWHTRLGSTNLLRRRLLEVAETEDGTRL
ncbi:CRISPR-associated endonuclease Cas1, partial [Singulisphaera rosea]